MEGEVWTASLWSDTSGNGLGIKEQLPTPRDFQAAGEFQNKRGKGSGGRVTSGLMAMALGLGTEEESAVLEFSMLNKRVL